MSVGVQDLKVESLIAPATVTLATNASSYGYLDCKDWDYATILVHLYKGATNVAAAKLLKITEGTNSTAATGIVALTGGTATSTSVGFVIPNFKGTAEGTLLKFDIDLRKRKRYLRLQCNVGYASVPTALAILSRGRAQPGSDAGSAQLHVIA